MLPSSLREAATTTRLSTVTVKYGSAWIVQPIAEMEDDDFMKLQTLYASEYRSARFAHLRMHGRC